MQANGHFIDYLHLGRSTITRREKFTPTLAAESSRQLERTMTRGTNPLHRLAHLLWCIHNSRRVWFDMRKATSLLAGNRRTEVSKFPHNMTRRQNKSSTCEVTWSNRQLATLQNVHALNLPLLTASILSTVFGKYSGD
jgi:hypothetical protein